MKEPRTAAKHWKMRWWEEQSWLERGVAISLVVGMALGMLYHCLVGIPDRIDLSALLANFAGGDVSAISDSLNLDALVNSFSALVGAVSILAASLLALNAAAQMLSSQVESSQSGELRGLTPARAGHQAFEALKTCGAFVAFGFVFMVVLVSWVDETLALVSAFIALMAIIAVYRVLLLHYQSYPSRRSPIKGIIFEETDKDTGKVYLSKSSCKNFEVDETLADYSLERELTLEITVFSSGDKYDSESAKRWLTKMIEFYEPTKVLISTDNKNENSIPEIENIINSVKKSFSTISISQGN